MPEEYKISPVVYGACATAAVAMLYAFYRVAEAIFMFCILAMVDPVQAVINRFFGG